MSAAAIATDQGSSRDAAAQQAPPRTSYQRREIQAAINHERARCAGILERAIEGAKRSGLEPLVRDILRGVLEAHLERIRYPWRVRLAARKRAMPRRLARSCGLCGGDGHTAPKCPDKQRLVTVCSACKQASCWQAKFMCQQSANADIEKRTVAELRALDLEHPDYWHPDCEAGER